MWSPQAKRKARTKRTEDDMPVHSFQTRRDDPRTIALKAIKMGEHSFDSPPVPTPLQQKAFDPPEVSSSR